MPRRKAGSWRGAILLDPQVLISRDRLVVSWLPTQSVSSVKMTWRPSEPWPAPRGAESSHTKATPARS